MSDNVIERFRETHHAIARMCAAGMTPSMIRRYTGVTQRRLTLYLADPAFNDLVTWHAKRLHDRWDFEDDVMGSLLRANAIRAEFTVQEHFEEAADRDELVPLMHANKISQERADRIGYGKHSTIQHNHDFASALERAITRSGKSEEMKIIDVKASATLPAAPSASVMVESPLNPPPEAEAIGKSQPPSILAEAVTNQSTPPRTTTELSCPLWSQETAAVGEKEAASLGNAQPVRTFAGVLRRRVA